MRSSVRGKGQRVGKSKSMRRVPRNPGASALWCCCAGVPLRCSAYSLNDTADIDLDMLHMWGTSQAASKRLGPEFWSILAGTRYDDLDSNRSTERIASGSSDNYIGQVDWLKEPHVKDGHSDAAQRLLSLTAFTGYSLIAPVKSNLLSFNKETTRLQDVRAGVPYFTMTLHASSSLGTDASTNHIKLMLTSASDDADCLPGSGHEAPHVVPHFGASTTLDGASPSRSPAQNFENTWEKVRFPYSGVFETCYFDGSSWRHVPAEFPVRGADTNVGKFWCVASTTIRCLSQISGLGVRKSWPLTVVNLTEHCGAVSAFGTAFERSYSLSLSGDSGNTLHSLGSKSTALKATYKVCLCPGFNEDGVGDMCSSPGDFAQLAGLLYATRVTTPENIYPKLRFDLVVNCGSEAAGGCPMSAEMRIKLVAPAFDNDRPAFDSQSGCRTAPQVLNHFLPPNCRGPTNCALEPIVISESMPRWAGLRLTGLVENHAQTPMTFDVCFCIGGCSMPESWFKVDRIPTHVIEVLPSPQIANSNTNFELRGPDGGWAMSGDTHHREMKLLFDPEGTITADECYLGPQDARAITGHVCYSTTDCQSPTTSSSDGHVWRDVRVRFAGMYAVCYCDTNCNRREFWSFVKWHLVAGPSSKHNWEFSRGIRFDLTVSGLGLQPSNRLRITEVTAVCGEASATPAVGVEAQQGPPIQNSDRSGRGLIAIRYAYDGSILLLRTPHGLAVEDYIELSNVKSDRCAHCATLLNGRPHKVIRVPSPLELVIPVSYPEKAFPEFNTNEVKWRQSNELTFTGLFGVAPATYRVCWGSDSPVNAEDFVGVVGTLTLFEPPVFEASIHLTSVQSNIVAPMVIAFKTRHDQKYANAAGEMQFKVHFFDTTQLLPGVRPSLSKVERANARQHVCGELFSELWSTDDDGFPMPRGCFYDTNAHEYGFLFGAKNGLRAGTEYQIVMDAQGILKVDDPEHYSRGVVHLWSMDDVSMSPFGVIEFAPADLDRRVLLGASGSHAQFHPVNGFKIIGDDAEVIELTYDAEWEVAFELRAAAGASIQEGNILRIFLWPLTQWDLGIGCPTSCKPQEEMVNGVQNTLRCEAPICVSQALVPSGTESHKNVMKLTFSKMDPITDLVKHIITAHQLRLPPGGFFSTAVGGELQAPDGSMPSYMVSTGALIYAKPTAVASILSHPGDGNEKPFRGEQSNQLYVRLVLGASIWSLQGQDTWFEIVLPQGYVCVTAEPAGVGLVALREKAPQGRGDIGLDGAVDGFWLYSGEVCTYRLRKHSIVYAGSAIFLKVTMNNPVFPLKRTDPGNTWTVKLYGLVGPMVGTSTVQVEGRVGTFSETGPSFQNNVAVLGKLLDTTLTPALFGAGLDRNYLSVFFTTEQGTQDTSPQLKLEMPDGFGFLPHCIVDSLEAYHYATLSSRRTGLTLPTNDPEITNCVASRAPGFVHLNVATMTLSRYMKLSPRTTYGFKIQVFNAKTFRPTQRNGFRLTTLSAQGVGIDATFNTIRFLASDGEGAGMSFGIYRVPMKPGSFVITLDNRLPFTETGLPSRIIIFPLRVPFDARLAVDWRVVAPHGYEWDYRIDQFKYRTVDILGVTADLPIARVPLPPSLPPKNILAFTDNFLGSWGQTRTYGFITMIRVPDSTPRSTTNTFFIEFGYSANTASGRLSAAAYEAPQVRSLINTLVDYQLTNLAGQLNRLLLRVQTITSLRIGGGLEIEAPEGFVFEERCVILDNPMRRAPSINFLSTAAAMCTSKVPYITKKPLVTFSIVSGEVRPAQYEFMIDAQNPRVEQDSNSMTWTIYAYVSIGNREPADLAATLRGFPIESPMRKGELVNSVNHKLTHRDDHPSQRSYVVLAFELGQKPSEQLEHVLTVKAPLGFEFAPLCDVIVGKDVFGPGYMYTFGYFEFEASATIIGCTGSLNTAKITVRNGLINRRLYVFRIEVFNPANTPVYNRWTISFAGQSTMPFRGFMLWRFTEVDVTPSHAAKSTMVEETKNTVTIRFRPTNAITREGFFVVQAPFGFQIATECHVEIQRLDPLKQPIAVVPHTSCHGAPQPTNTAEIHMTSDTASLVGLELHQLKIEVVNPLVIPVDPGSWHLSSYRTKQAEYANLLDVGDAPSFLLTEVFHTLQVIYPYITPKDETLLLTFVIILPHSVEIGDVLEVDGPPGYDFGVVAGAAQHAMEFRACERYSSSSPSGLPAPQCKQNHIRFLFQTVGIELDPREGVTPLIQFRVQTVYPRRTLAPSESLFHGEHTRGEVLLSSKTVLGQVVTPRLQGLKVSRLDSMRAVGSTSSVQVSFSPSQSADAFSVTSSGILQHDYERKFTLEKASISGTVELQLITALKIMDRSNITMSFETELREGLAYVFVLHDAVNPVKPGRALWTITTYKRPASVVDDEVDWLTVENRRDWSMNVVGPRTISRIEIDVETTVLADRFFDVDGTELQVGFRVYPTGISAGQYLILYAPYGFTFVDRTFKDGDGFPQVSGSVYVRGVRPGDVVDEWAGRAYVIQTLSSIRINQLVKFAIRVNTPRTPDDMALWETDYASSWLLLAAAEADGQEPSASNDHLFPGFLLKASFGSVHVEPEPNGVTPRKNVVAVLTINPQSTLRSLKRSGDASLHVRITAPIGFEFDPGCLAVTPNAVFLSCTGNGRIAILPARDAILPAGATATHLRVTNAGATASDNRWQLESFVDMPMEAVETTDVEPRQQSYAKGYRIRELIQATIGANTQRGAVTTVFVWFLATNFVDVGGSVELHAPQNYELRCAPRVQYISLPAGSCKLLKGTTSSSQDDYHHYLVLTLTLSSQLVFPNTAYEFGVSAVNPHVPSNPNFWGLVMRNARKEVLDATMTLNGYELQDFGLAVGSLLASSTLPTVVNFVRLTLTFQRTVPAGKVQHITVIAPPTTKVLCPQFMDISGGGSTTYMLPVDAGYGVYGTHSCQFQYSVTIHLLITEEIRAGSYVLRMGVLNPAVRAVRDYWSVRLIGPDITFSPGANATLPQIAGAEGPAASNATSLISGSSGIAAAAGDWRTSEPILRIEVRGFGVSSAFSGQKVAAIPVASFSLQSGGQLSLTAFLVSMIWVAS